MMRRDSDIFNAKAQPIAPRIVGQQASDPYTAFRKTSEAKFDDYMRRVAPKSHLLTEQARHTQVNEKAVFDEHYHRLKKEQDMTSSIFCQPTPQRTAVSRVIQTPPEESSKQTDHGRKETMAREIASLPYNACKLTGNESRLFEFKQQNTVKTEVDHLVPVQMKWDTYDSVRHEGERKKTNSTGLDLLRHEPLTESLMMSASTLPSNELVNCKELNGSLTIKIGERIGNQKASQMPENQEPNTKKKSEAKTQKPVGKDNQQKGNINSEKPVQSQQVKINVIKGWSTKLLEPLTKWCRLNGTEIISFSSDTSQTCTITLRKSKRWESVTDWLMKQGKVKLRVV